MTDQELAGQVNALLRAIGQWGEPDDGRALSDDDADLVRLLSEDRLARGTPSHGQAVDLVARNREARALWHSFIGMQQVVQQHALDQMEQSLANTDPLTVEGPSTDYSAQVINLVERLKRRKGETETIGFRVQRLAAQTTWDSVARGRYVAGDLVMSLVFTSMAPDTAPSGFLMTCPVETIAAKYAGKRFRVLFVEAESQVPGPVQHRLLEVGPFDSAGEIEVRFDEVEVGKCVIPVWVDLVE